MTDSQEEGEKNAATIAHYFYSKISLKCPIYTAFIYIYRARATNGRSPLVAAALVFKLEHIFYAFFMC